MSDAELIGKGFGVLMQISRGEKPLGELLPKTWEEGLPVYRAVIAIVQENPVAVGLLASVSECDRMAVRIVAVGLGSMIFEVLKQEMDKGKTNATV